MQEVAKFVRTFERYAKGQLMFSVVFTRHAICA